MKKKRLAMNRVVICFFVIILSLAIAKERFSVLANIGDKENDLPTIKIFMKPDGGYIAFWVENIKQKNESHYHHYFFSIVDAESRIIIDKGEIDLWRTTTGVRFNAAWLDTERLLLLGWKLGYYESPERIILNSSGEIMSGPETFRGGSSDASLLKDSKGNVYAVWCIPVVGVLQVYPDIKQHKSTYDWSNYYKRYPTFGFRDPVVTVTSKDELLICSRVGWGYTPLEEQGIWDGPFRPDKIFYFLADLEGNLVTDPMELDIVENAFRKVPGIHLGGMYYTLSGSFDIDDVKLVSEDMDLSILPSGEIILCVTAPDKSGNLDVYQLKFTPQGKFMKPEHIEVVNARPLPMKNLIPVIECEKALIWLGAEFRGLRTDLVLFGYDEEGNFYSEREVWKENEK